MSNSSSNSNTTMLTDLQDLLQEDLVKTNQFILTHLDSQVEMIPKLGTHLISSGGKRLRPILTLIGAKLFGYQGEDHALIAAVVEFIHTATLLHDDVVDKSTTRRGRATANAVWGSKAPVLVGDFLFSRAFQLLVGHGDLQILKIISDACAVISEGEVLQLVISKDLSTTEEKYMEVVSRKTATLFAAAAHAGAVLGGASPDLQVRLTSYGLLLGNAYQVVDDALDYAADQDILGKTVGDDFQEGKITLPVIHAFQHGSDEEKNFWRLCLEQGVQDEASLQRAIVLVQERGSVAYALDRAATFIEEAKQEIQPLPDSREKAALLTLADFAVQRSF